MDGKRYTDELHRSWIFRTVGIGTASQWKDIMSNLRLVGYDHVVSIEHRQPDVLRRGAEKGLPVLERRGDYRGAGRGLLGVRARSTDFSLSTSAGLELKQIEVCDP